MEGKENRTLSREAKAEGRIDPKPPKKPGGFSFAKLGQKRRENLVAQGLVPAAEGGDEASDGEAASSSAPEADPLLAVNISTSSSVDAANLQRVLTFLVLCGLAVRGAGVV